MTDSENLNASPFASKRKRTNNLDAARKRTLQTARSSRRGSTPIVLYEPPTDVFTPPREVFLNPMTNTMSKSSKRKTVASSSSSFKSAKGKRRGSTLAIVTAVKQELPDIDLTLPMPPPSPSDDPLLLSGPPEFDFFSEPTTDDPLLLSGPPEFDCPREPTPIKREMSAAIAMDDEKTVRVFDWGCNNNNGIAPLKKEEDDDQISDDSDELSRSIVKITSADPRSAARAATFMTQHDYDCYTNIEIKQCHQEAKHRRKSDIVDSAKESRCDVFEIYDGDISKQEWTNEDWKHLDGCFTADIKDSAKESRRRDVLEIYGGDIGKREWTEEDWKHLDACFTDQRLKVGSRFAGSEQNMLASVDIVSIDDVVDKFVISKGGFETITSFGELWSRENLLERTRTLQKNQRSGSIAPPTTSTMTGERVKGLLFSYLPTLPKSSSATVSKVPLSLQSSLPLPPIEILSKPRGPITTPARAPILKPKHPKELVVLHPAPQPQTVSHIPRLKKPQRLVELKPPAPPPMIEQPIPRPRRSSGSSVKDLVRGFEEIQAVYRDKLKYNLGWKTGDQKRAKWKP